MILNDIRVAVASLREASGARQISLLGASFGGGICAYYCAKRRDDLGLALLNPQLDYKKRTIDSRDYRNGDVIDDEKARELNDTVDARHGPQPRRKFPRPDRR